MEGTPERFIREYLVSRMTLIIDNNSADLYNRVTAAAVEVLNGEGVITKDDYRMATDGRGGFRREEIEDVIGVEVVDILREMVAGIEDDTMRTIVGDVLDLSDREQRRMLGSHYWPDDDEAFMDADDDDDDDRETVGECGFCGGRVVAGESGGYVHADDGDRVTVSGPGDMVSGAHNRAGSAVNPADVVFADDEDDEDPEEVRENYPGRD